MFSVLALGLLIGMQHALEADHVAAVAAIAARQTSRRRIVVHGAVWGLGHTLALMAAAAAVMLFGLAIGETLAARFELVVGIMLVALGGHLVYRLVRDRVHFHSHRHADGVVHFHAHSHRGEDRDHGRSDHDHDHPRGLPVRTLVVGMVHGLAGSAALLILTASTVQAPALGLAYVALFGIGSIAGMAALSALMAVPLGWSARALTWAHGCIRGAVGAATAVLGAVLISETWRLALATS